MRGNKLQNKVTKFIFNNYLIIITKYYFHIIITAILTVLSNYDRDTKCN